MFREPEDEEEADKEEEDDSAVSDHFKWASMLMQVFQIVVGVLILSLLIIILVFCDRKVLPRCCPCFKKIVDLIKSKIMFNSLLRAILQTFLLTCISMWSAFQQSEVSSAQGMIDIGVAMLIFFFAFSSPVIVYRLLKQKYNE